MSYIYHTLFFDPLYNGLISLFDIFPWMDAGVAVIIFTMVIKLILYPLSKKAIVTQVRMKEIEPELAKLREKFPDRQTQGLKTLELYKEKGVNPFSSFFLLLIQLPVLIALYHVFVSSGLPAINPTYLYSFVTAPTIDMYFLGLLDISKASIIMSLLASVSQFLQLHYSLAAANVKMPTSSSNNANNVGNIAMNMNKQMKYIFPVIIFIFSYKISAVIALYWAVSSLFTLGQELFVRRKLAQGTSLN